MKPKGALLGSDDASTSPGLGFGSWRTPSSTRSVDLVVVVTVTPTALTDGEVNLDVDESGGTTADYSYRSFAEAGLGASRTVAWTIRIPPGGSYQFRNTSDPAGSNAITTLREYVQ